MTETIYDVCLNRIDGESTTLAEFKGKVLLVVNVASKCGLTPQYDSLEKLYEAKRAEGLEVLGFPSNDFGAQEPGTDAEIADFCATSYQVQFPLFSKIAVKGPEKHALYDKLTSSVHERTGEGALKERLRSHGIETGDPQEIMWNFEKFLIGRDGAVLGRFAPDMSADDPRLVTAIDKALAEG